MIKLLPILAIILFAFTTANVSADVTPVRAATYVVCSAGALDTVSCDFLADGVDDHVEIQAAIDALPTTGGRVLLSEGVFSVAGSIDLSANLILEGQGFGTEIQQAAGANLHNILSIVWAEGVTVRNLTVNGQKDLQTWGNGVGIRLGDGASYATVEHINLVDTRGRGISMYGNSSEVVVQNLRVERTTGDAIYAGQFNVQVLNNVVLDAGNGIMILQANGSIVTGNVVRDSGRNGIELLNSKNVIVSNNLVKGSGYLGMVFTDSEGIAAANNRLTYNDNNGIDCNNSKHVSITGNVSSYNGSAQNAQYSNLEGNGILTWRCKHVTISGNVTFNNGQGQPLNRDGIRVADDGITAGHHIVVTGNRSYDTQTTPTQGYGIRIGGAMPNQTVNYVILQGNDVIGNGIAGIGITGAVSGADLIIRDNLGFTTESNGFASIEDGNTSVIVTHGLDIKPSAKDCAVTPNNYMGFATKFWINSFNDTTFAIRVNNDPGAGKAVFAWTCSVQ